MLAGVSAQGNPAFSRLKIASRSGQVRDQLEGAISRGEYQAADRLPSERELSELFGVSRVSVREAMRSLEAIGLVKVRHGDGIFVTDPSERRQLDLSHWLSLHRDEAVDLALVRGALDELAAERAALVHSPEDIAVTRAAQDAFVSAVNGDASIERIIELDIDLHTAVARASGSDLLAHLLGDLHQRLGASRRVAFERPDRRFAAAREHEAIVSALEAGDATLARQAVARHMEHVRDLLEDRPD